MIFLKILSEHDNKFFDEKGKKSLLKIYFGRGPLLTKLYVCPILALKIHKYMTISKVNVFKFGGTIISL